eukprot:TRINITY_DN4450_c0_g2_i1.p4 TRINITY_DN4450_c0_g2~~TRINITY_DN4450_c0_g2_i1.p4  ORF type:complete len:108 (+),score=12.32 TRINITY_DN4450_c0_g2_i1:465-788(+)
MGVDSIYAKYDPWFLGSFWAVGSAMMGCTYYFYKLKNTNMFKISYFIGVPIIGSAMIMTAHEQSNRMYIAGIKRIDVKQMEEKGAPREQIQAIKELLAKIEREEQKN